MLLLLELATAGSGVSVASDLTPWVLEGYSVILMVDAEPWRVGLEMWGMNMPTSLVELNPANVDKDWTRRVDLALALYVDHHLRPDNAGWHVGLAFDALRSTVQREQQSASFWSLELLLRGGYRWFPFEGERLFVNPWAAVGPLLALEEPEVGGVTFDELPFQALATCHVGWRFD